MLALHLPARQHQILAQLHLRDDLATDDRKRLALALVELPRHAVDGAERAKRVTRWRDQRRTRIEAQVKVARDQRVVGEAGIPGSVRNREYLARVEDGMRAERGFTRRGFRVQPYA